MRSKDGKKKPVPNYHVDWEDVEEYIEEEMSDEHSLHQEPSTPAPKTGPFPGVSRVGRQEEPPKMDSQRVATLEANMTRVLAILEAKVADSQVPLVGANLPQAVMTTTTGVAPKATPDSRVCDTGVAPSRQQRSSSRQHQQQRSTPKKRKKSTKPGSKKRKHRAPTPEVTSEEDSESQEETSSEEETSFEAGKERDHIPLIRFDIDTLTGKPNKKRNGKSRI